MALDSDAAQAAGVPVPASSKDDYLKQVADIPTTLGPHDANDPQTGWTVQTGGSFHEPADVPGQVYLPSQLPDPARAVANGLPPVQVPEHLIVEDASHPQGPEPSELAMADARQKIAESVVANQVEAQKAAAQAIEDNKNGVGLATDESGQAASAQPGSGSGSSSAPASSSSSSSSGASAS